MSTPSITQPVASQEFTPEQKQYLEGFFAGIAQRGLLPFAGDTASGQITNDPAQALWFNTPPEDLCKEERFKLDQDPFAIWDQILAYAAANQPPTEADRFRMKYFGLFHVAPTQDSFMLRLRVPGGVLTTHQIRGIAQIAADWGNSRCDLTTRANIQLRELQPKDVVRVLAKIQSLGLTSRGSGADNIRNITASPLSGLDPHELLNVMPLAEALQLYISNSPDMYQLPRKFNIAFDSGGTISTLADTNDIGFQAVCIPAGRSVPPGVYFRVLLCGITGHRQFATDAGILLRPDQTVACAAAMVRVFVQHGDRTDRKKARLKYLIDNWGVEKFIAETEKLLAFPLIHTPAEESAPRHPINRAGHIGVHPQLQPDLHTIGLSIPVGRLPVAQMHAIAAIADQFGSGEIRLTVWQNLLIPNIPTAALAAAQSALTAASLSYAAGTVLSGTVACTGNQGCRFAATDTKSHAVALANALDARFPLLDQPLNLHVTGCNNSCAQHYIGDIGLMGVKVAGEEGYQVVLGGGSDQDQAIARELIPAIPFPQLQPKLEALLTTYTTTRVPQETFLAFTRRHSIDQLKQFAGVS